MFVSRTYLTNDEENAQQLLQAYLQHAPSEEALKRFNLMRMTMKGIAGLGILAIGYSVSGTNEVAYPEAECTLAEFQRMLGQGVIQLDSAEN
mgnify:CR=1 FL=1